MSGPRVLVLGGTAEGRELAARLLQEDCAPVHSLAGRTPSPLPGAAATRTGGFGGVAGLRAWLRENAIEAVIDATHPYAASMSANAARACAAAGVPLLALVRPGWAGHPEASRWHWVDDHAQAALVSAAITAARGGSVFLTIGRQRVGEYVPALAGIPTLVRVASAVDPTADPAVLRALPPAWTLLVATGPFGLAEERALVAGRRVAVLVTKDSGGSATSAKLEAARLLDVPVVVVRRPRPEPGVDTAPDLDAAVAWCLRVHERITP